MDLEYVKNQINFIIEKYKNNEIDLSKEDLKQIIDEFIEKFDSENLISIEDKNYFISIKEDL